MILYHGTNIDFQKIDIRESNPYKDFGQGFYLTDIFLQAENMANKKARILGGEPIILKYQFEEAYLTDSSLNVLIFEKPDKEWAEFIYKNRTRSTPAFSHDYDIVIGPIADDGVAYLLNRYEEGFCTANYLIEDFHLDIPSALNVIYTSDTYRILSDTENDLYSQSPSYVYEWLKQEFLTGKM